LYDFGSSNQPIAAITIEEASSSSTGLPSSFRCGAFGKGKLDGYIIVAGGNQIRLYSLPNLTLYSIFRVRAKAVTCIAQSQDSRTIAYGCSDGSIGFLSNSLSNISFRKDCHAFAISSICFGNDFLISGSIGGTLVIIPKTFYSKDWGFLLMIVLSALIAYLAYLYYIHQ
jgi:WD40 repeat protein